MGDFKPCSDMCEFAILFHKMPGMLLVRDQLLSNGTTLKVDVEVKWEKPFFLDPTYLNMLAQPGDIYVSGDYGFQLKEPNNVEGIYICRSVLFNNLEMYIEYSKTYENKTTGQKFDHVEQFHLGSLMSPQYKVRFLEENANVKIYFEMKYFNFQGRLEDPPSYIAPARLEHPEAYIGRVNTQPTHGMGCAAKASLECDCH